MTDQQYVLSSEERTVVNRTLELMSGLEPEPLTENERNGLRAFLQRGETRLSTYQRVAGAFLNGAGLLVLLPTLARESVSSSIHFAFDGMYWPAKVLLLPWLISTGIPLYAFYWLLKDLVQFYFSPRFFALDPLRITRFALAGLTLPYDESIEAKARVMKAKMEEGSAGSNYVDFILGGTSMKSVVQAQKESNGGKAAFPLRWEIMERLRKSNRGVDMNNAEMIGVSLSLAGSLDQSLVKEVARMEASLARHVLLLRKLVLRYSKALILFVWTTIILLTVWAILSNSEARHENWYAAISFFIYSVWAAAAVHLVKLPLRWIDALLPARKDDVRQEPFRDPDLEQFEKVITVILYSSAVIFLGMSVYIVGTMGPGAVK